MNLRIHVIICLFLLTALSGCSREPQSRDAGKLKTFLVMASILPLADFVRHVGGERVQVEVVIPPGVSEHIYEPTPDKLQSLSKARLLVLNGLHLEFWADSMVGAANNQNLLVIKVGEGLPVIYTAEPSEEKHVEHGKGTGNSHFWLDPLLAIKQVEKICEALIKVDPSGEQTYRKNAAKYADELKTLDREIAEKTEKFKIKKFIAFHAAWVYFAKRYGLEEVGVIEASPGKEPSPAEVKAIVQTAKQIGARAIFAEDQFPTKAADTIAAESGAKVLLLNPLCIPPDYDYIKTMQHNVAIMEEALGEARD